jgi:LysM repeat protein
MSDRGLPIVDGAPACPFVAFEDDRDGRASSPDHRHRCYAEVRPAPRALAHQEAYCLSSAFPVCPTFQDWARREAARERAGGGAPPSEEAPRRNPPRDWSAPPPWSGGSGAAAAAGADGIGDGDDEDADPDAPDFLVRRERAGSGLAGSSADRLAGPDRDVGAIPEPSGQRSPRDGSDVREPDGPEQWAERDRDRERDPDRERELDPGRDQNRDGRPEPREPRERREDDASAPPPFFARRGEPRGSQVDEEDDDWGDEDDERGRRSSRRDRSGGFALGGDRRPKVGDTRRTPPRDAAGPSWERPRRYEAYPTLKTRMGLPAIPRVGVMAAALALAAIALFFLPQILGLGSDDGNGPGPGASGSPGVSSQPSASLAPTPVPQPTPQLYIVAPGDTMSRIANRFGVSLDQLIEANRENIPDPDALQIGDEVIIPAVAPDEIGESAAPSAAAP